MRKCDDGKRVKVDVNGMEWESWFELFVA